MPVMGASAGGWVQPAMIATVGIYHEANMDETGVAKIFMHGRSQAVRLPKAFRLPGNRVGVRRVGSGVLLEPKYEDVNEWFAALDRYRDVPFMEDGRDQPPMPANKDLFE
jgi:antitoxin VapB